MAEIVEKFDDTVSYPQDSTAIVALLGNKKRQAQLRYYGRSPRFYKVGNRIFYRGLDLNAFILSQVEKCAND